MRRLIAFLAAALCAASALALTPSQSLLLFGGISPVVYTDFTQTGSTLPSSLYSYSSPSLRTITDATGAITYAPNNMLTYSNAFSTTPWTNTNATLTPNAITDPNGGNTGWKMAATTTAFSVIASPAITASINGIFVLYIHPGNVNYVNIGYNGDAGVFFNASTCAVSSNTISATTTVALQPNGWCKVSIAEKVPAGTNGNLFIIPTSSPSSDVFLAGNYAYIWSGVYSAVTYETTPRPGDQVVTQAAAYYGPAFDYDPVTHAPLGLRIEESRTNLITNSLYSTSVWGQTPGDVITNLSATSPDGTRNASLFADNATSEAHNMYLTAGITPAAATNYAFSTYLKNNTVRYMTVAFATGGLTNGYYVNVDLTLGTITATGTLGTGTYVSSSITSVGNSWYRVVLVGAMASTTTAYPIVGTIPNGTQSPAVVWAGAGNSGYAWGAQLEAGSFPTSCIPTGSASVTRAADVVALQGPALTAVQGTNASVIAEANPASSFAQFPIIINNGAPSVLQFNTTGNAQNYQNASVLATANAGTLGAFNRLGTSWTGAPTRAVALNGGGVANDATAMNARSSVYLGSNASANFLDGYIRKLALYNRALTPPQLQARTVLGAPF